MGEMRCKCRRGECDAINPDAGFMAKLQALRDQWGAVHITSGCRCAYWNQKVGGKPESMHLLGRAADLFVSGREARDKLGIVARKVGMKGLGFGMSFLHVDDRDGPVVTWTYK